MSVYTAQDQWVWKTLFERQVENLKGKVCEEFAAALKKMEPVLHANAIPDFRKVNDWFCGETGWQIEVVPGLIPVADFFRLLAEKRFPSSTWLRSKEQLDYLEEPDMFHDTFGHVPLLANHVFSDFMQAFGELGCAQLHDEKKLLALQRLYWFTIEFGLLERDQPLIYGAGIISSFGETNRAVSGTVEYRPFEMESVMNAPFRTDVVQEHYVCITGFDALFMFLKKVEEKWQQAIGV